MCLFYVVQVAAGTFRMTITKDMMLLIFLGLILMNSAWRIIAEESAEVGGSGYLSEYVTPNSYKLEIQPFLHEGHFQGKVGMKIICIKPTDSIVLHAHSDLSVVLKEQSIHSIGTVENSITETFSMANSSHWHERISATNMKHSVTIMKLQRNMNNSICEIILKEKLKKGMVYELKMEFSGSLTTGENRGLYRRRYEEGDKKQERWYIATEMDEHNARRVFPCLDDPRFKATFQISIVRPSKLHAVSNMPLESSENMKNQTGWKIDHFKATPPMSTQSLAITIFDPASLVLVKKEKLFGSVTVYAYAQPSKEIQFKSKMKHIIHMIQLLESYTAMPFPLPELHLIAVPQSAGRVLSDYWGLVTFSDQDLDNEFYTLQLLITLPNQWVGHMIAADSDMNAKVNEGINLFLLYVSLIDLVKGTKYDMSIHWGPTMILDVNYIGHDIIRRQSDKEVRIMRLLRMLNYTLTENTFKRAFRNFLQERKFNGQAEKNFFEVLDKQAWLDGTLYASVSTNIIAKGWIDYSDYPIVKVARIYENNSATCEQHVSHKEGLYEVSDEEFLWWLPITYISEQNLDMNSRIETVWMKGEKQITINNLPAKDNFIIVNPENIDKYIVNYDLANWNMLSKYLMESSSTRKQKPLSAETRSKLLYNAVHLALIDELDFSTALDMTLFMRYEKDVSVWGTVFHPFIYIFWKVSLNNRIMEKYLEYCRYVFVPAYNSFQNEGPHDEPLREFIEYFNAFVTLTGHEPALKKAINEFDVHVKQNTLEEFNVLTFCAICQYLDVDMEYIFKTTLDALTQNKSLNSHSDKNVHFFLLFKCTKDSEKLKRLFYKLLLDDNLIFPDRVIKKALYFIKQHYVFIQFIKDHWDSLKLRYGDNPDIWNAILGEATRNFVTEEGYQQVLELYQDHQDTLGTAKSIVEQALTLIKENEKTANKFFLPIEKWLDHHVFDW